MSKSLGLLLSLGVGEEKEDEEHQVMILFPSPHTELLKCTLETFHKSRTINAGTNPACKDSGDRFKGLPSTCNANGSLLVRDTQRMTACSS
jgi:hypothetical protein